MSLAIALFVLVLLGFILFGYSMNKDKSVNKEDALKSGKEIHRKQGEY